VRDLFATQPSLLTNNASLLAATRKAHHKSILVCAQSDDVQKLEGFVDFFISAVSIIRILDIYDARFGRRAEELLGGTLVLLLLQGDQDSMYVPWSR
jgi:hypothetical protein